ncbi:Hypothetical protein, predicted transmembrane protein [Metamycoplasma auris 15026]|uniref:Uncharacterized protein n=1 Tax=Metamycoplasma auris 15026 TaxID=1188233 RepID=N9V1J7_9BACT|nr:hypothetical protein [Metamycoplasma auris]ENY69242.1 Hypothetical protein, predicted transmembrane protein [Metamycoplasma auris 15026]
MKKYSSLIAFATILIVFSSLLLIFPLFHLLITIQAFNLVAEKANKISRILVITSIPLFVITIILLSIIVSRTPNESGFRTPTKTLLSAVIIFAILQTFLYVIILSDNIALAIQIPFVKFGSETHINLIKNSRSISHFVLNLVIGIIVLVNANKILKVCKKKSEEMQIPQYYDTHMYNEHYME